MDIESVFGGNIISLSRVSGKVVFSRKALIHTLFPITIIILTVHGFYSDGLITDVFRYIRYGCIAIITILVISHFFNRILVKHHLTNSSFLITSYLVMILIATITTVMNIGFLKHIDAERMYFIIVSVPIMFIIIAQMDGIHFNNISDKTHKLQNGIFIIYFVVGTLAVIAAQKLTFDPLPKFTIIRDNQEKHHSQGVTFIYALAAIYFILLASKLSFGYRYVFILLSLTYLGVSLFGGARGDFIVGLIVYICILVKLFPVRYTIFLLLILGWIVVKLLNSFSLDEIIFFQRMAILLDGDSFGNRDVLWGLSMDLLFNEPLCLLFGCGFDYFQYKTVAVTYPHNLILELIITYGLFISVPIILLVALGLIGGFVSEFGNHFVYYFLLFQFGVLMKSGTLLTMNAFPVLISLCLLGLYSVRSVRFS